MIWSDVPFILHNGGYVPPETAVEGRDFIVVTDHSRSALEMSPTRIESRSRMINGTSRSYYTADKAKIEASWTLLPSRIAANPVIFNNETGAVGGGGEYYIADDASAATDLINWYDSHPYEFYVYLSYDLGSEEDTMTKYIDQKLFHFVSFGKTLEKRGIYDMWGISVSLEEV